MRRVIPILTQLQPVIIINRSLLSANISLPPKLSLHTVLLDKSMPNSNPNPQEGVSLKVAMPLPRVSGEFPDIPVDGPVKPCRKRSIELLPNYSESPPVMPIRQISLGMRLCRVKSLRRSIEMPEREGNAPVKPYRHRSTDMFEPPETSPVMPSRKKSAEAEWRRPPSPPKRDFRFLRLSPVMPHRKCPSRSDILSRASSDSSDLLPVVVQVG